MKTSRKTVPLGRLSCFLILFSSAAAAADMRLYTASQPHMGTEFTLRTYAPEEKGKAVARAFKKAFARVETLNQVCSDYLPESEINQFAKAPVGERIALSADLFKILRQAEGIAADSEGAFDITAGPFVRLWRLSKKNRRLPTEAQIIAARSRSGFHLLSLDPFDRTATKLSEGMLFDLGGIAKGVAADEALGILKESGFPRALVAASGDIVVGDPPPGKPNWTVQIEAVAGINENLPPIFIHLNKAAVSTSGDTRQYVEIDGNRYSHIVSTDTGLGISEGIAASVIAPSAMLSDAYATTVALLGEKEGLQFIENKREIECRIVALRNGQEVAITSHGFSQFQEEERQEKSALTSP